MDTYSEKSTLVNIVKHTIRKFPNMSTSFHRLTSVETGLVTPLNATWRLLPYSLGRVEAEDEHGVLSQDSGPVGVV